jgi:hypothetical protein
MSLALIQEMTTPPAEASPVPTWVAPAVVIGVLLSIVLLFSDSFYEKFSEVGQGFIGNSSSSSIVCFGISGGERLTGGKQMDGNRSEVGDERNTSFELPEYTKEVTSGFDPGEEPSEVSEGHDRFPQRLKQEDIPQESLAERIRRDRQGG